MAKITLKRINIISSVKWHVLSSLVSGFFVGIIYSAIGYFMSKENALGYLFWYVLGIPIFYLAVGLLTSVAMAFLYNTLSDSVGGLQFEMESEAENHNAPPTK